MTATGTRSLNHFSSKSIASTPEVADWAPIALVVDALLVRATNYPIGYDDREGAMDFDKLQYLSRDFRVGAHVPVIGLPIAQLRHFRAFGWHNADSDFARPAEVRTVKRNRGNGPTPHAFA